MLSKLYWALKGPLEGKIVGLFFIVFWALLCEAGFLIDKLAVYMYIYIYIQINKLINVFPDALMYWSPRNHISQLWSSLMSII